MTLKQCVVIRHAAQVTRQTSFVFYGAFEILDLCMSHDTD